VASSCVSDVRGGLAGGCVGRVLLFTGGGLGLGHGGVAPSFASIVSCLGRVLLFGLVVGPSVR
jgi:hypothetical protein